MLNVICNIAAVDGKKARYTIKMREDSIVQDLIDRIQTRFNEPMTKIQRNTTSNEGPAEILFFDEPIDVGDEFWMTFSRANSEISINNLEYEVPTFDQMPQLIASNQPLPPSSHGSPLQLINQSTPLHNEQKSDMPINNTEQIIVPFTPALSNVTVDAVIKGTKAEQIVEKLKRNEDILPSERQLLVRVAGRWLMDFSLVKYKPSSQERSYFTKRFFGTLPNFNYDIRDFHNSQSRGFLDVFIYNERDRKTRSGELNRPSINPDTVVKSLKRKHNRINVKDEHNPFINLVVPPEPVTTLTRLELDEHAFESRYIEFVSKEFGNSEASISLTRTWEDSVAPKILQYIKKINPEFYQRTINGQELTSNVISNSALQMTPFLVRRLHRENSNTKVTSFLVKLEGATDDQILAHMRACNDPGPFIAMTDEKTYLLVVMDKILALEQSSSAALEKLIKSYFVYNLQLTQLRKAIMNLLLICLGIQKSMTSSFKEVCQCIMSCQLN